MSPDVADRKFSVAIKTAYGAALSLVIATGGVVAAALRLNSTIDRLNSDHYGSAHHVRWSQTLATYNPDMTVPDPVDVIEGRASVREITIPDRYRGSKHPTRETTNE